MTTIYLINNSLTLNNLTFPATESLTSKREKRPLSIAGEQASASLVNDVELNDVSLIYSSPYVMSISTAKYLASHLSLEINIKEQIGEQIIGELKNNKIRLVRERQENDFSYKLTGGESLNDVKMRMLSFLKTILQTDEGKSIAVFTHNVAITCLLAHYCEKGFNLDNRLILNYQNDAIIDGAWDGINIIKLVFDHEDLISITRKK